MKKIVVLYLLILLPIRFFCQTASLNVSIIDIDKIKNSLESYVNDEFAKWVQQGKFESANEYNSRVNNDAKQNKIDDLIITGINLIASKVITLSISNAEYDPDNEVYKLTLVGLPSVYIKVPKSTNEALLFEKNLSTLKLNEPKYTLTDKGFALLSLQIINPTNQKSYIYAFNNELSFRNSTVSSDLNPITIKIGTTLKQVPIQLLPEPIQLSNIISKNEVETKSVKQFIPLKIILSNPKIEEGEIFDWASNEIRISGEIKSDITNTLLYVNNKEVLLFDNGSFMVNLLLVNGINNVNFKAIGENVQISNFTFKINYQPLSENSANSFKGKYYALLIGINKYIDPLINELNNPIKDAELFYNTIVSKYSFESENIKLLRDATMADIINALDYFAKKVTPEDNFLIFYAGHGTWDPTTQIGFWLPSDARRESKLAWFRNSTLRDYLLEIKSKHTLLISDACFSGSIFKTRGAFVDASIAIDKLYELPSRKAMTSGTLTEVPDQSVFLKYLIDRLLKNKEKYLSSEQLFSSLRIAVSNNSNVLPQFGEIRDVGDEGGDFIFILK